jgi:hypothetical protein
MQQLLSKSFWAARHTTLAKKQSRIVALAEIQARHVLKVSQRPSAVSDRKAVVTAAAPEDAVPADEGEIEQYDKTVDVDAAEYAEPPFDGELLSYCCCSKPGCQPCAAAAGSAVGFAPQLPVWSCNVHCTSSSV